jgi:S-methyl-1-thioxylulose 5-phosphate methylthiotransferase
MSDPGSVHRRAEGYRWERVDRLPYKEDERARFRSVSRQLLFRDPALAGELRYFEVAPGGFTSLERHAHMHAVLILRGTGQCLVGNEIKSVQTHDLIAVPPWAWHQFRASGSEPLGFLCLVNATRDAPQVASDEDLAALRREPQIAAFLREDAGRAPIS